MLYRQNLGSRFEGREPSRNLNLSNFYAIFALKICDFDEVLGTFSTHFVSKTSWALVELMGSTCCSRLKSPLNFGELLVNLATKFDSELFKLASKLLFSVPTRNSIQGTVCAKELS